MPEANTIKNNSFGSSNDKIIQGMKFINPSEIVEKLNIEAGMAIADFGCGTGYFSFPLAQKTGKSGTVYAIDLLKSKLESIASEAKLQGLSNVVAKRANLEMAQGSNLASESIDWVILVNMLFQNNEESRKKIIKEAKRVLKKGGHMLVIEWDKNNPSFGPDLDLRIPKEKLINLVRENGLGVLEELDISNFHYGLILTKYN